MRRSWCVGIAIGSFASSASADVRDALHVAPDVCVTQDALAHAIEFWLQRSTLTEPVDFDVSVDKTTVQFTTRRLGSVVGTRRLQTGKGTCPEVLDAVGLAIALTIDATLLDRIGIEAPPPPPLSLPPLPPPPLPPPPVPTPQVIVSPRPLGVRWELDARAVTALDVLPGWVGGAEIGAGVLLGSVFSVRASTAWVGGSTTDVGAGHVDASLWMGRVDACVGSTPTRVRVRGCAGAAAGAVFAQGVGYAPSYTPTLPWGALAVRMDVRVPFTPRWGVVFGVDWLVALARLRFDVGAPGGGTYATARGAWAGLGASMGVDFIGL